MKFHYFLMVSCLGLPALADEGATGPDSAAAANAIPQGQQKMADMQYGRWQLYNRIGQPVTGRDIARARAVERAVEKAGVDSRSNEAALIRMGMGQPPEVAYEPNDAVFDNAGQPLTEQEIAEYLTIQEAMARGGVEPGSEEEAKIVAAVKGQRQTSDGAPVDQQTYEEMAKELAVQQAIMQSGAQPGGAGEAMIRTGADVLMEKMRSRE